MTTGSISHIILLIATIIFIIISSIIISKAPRKLQNIMYCFAAIVGSGGIFFRYAMDLSFKNGIDIQSLLIQMLQVCNFNFILLPLMLIPKFEGIRQYSVFFSMFAASTTLLSIPNSLNVNEWNDILFLNFWFNHVFAIALPVWMIASKRLCPRKKYIPIVSLCVFLYFSIVYLATEGLMTMEIIPQGSSFSYVHDPKGMPIITWLYNLIGLPFVHLIPLFPVLIIFFYLWTIPFKKTYKYSYKR